MDATSQQQLEAAARAAGYEPVRLTDDGTALLLKGVQSPWNPRDENPHSDCMGDALRLAVALELEIHIERTFVRVWTQSADCVDVEVAADKAATTRRSIVHAAAAVGKAL